MLFIIADDLTGALDTAAPFASLGFVTNVAISPQDLPAALIAAPDVVAISTRSREMGSAQAHAVVAQVLANLPQGAQVFKKIDSRMKGHIAAELAAFAPARLLVAPALPEFGRVVKDGMVTGFGVAEPIAIAPCLGEFADRAVIPDSADDKDLDQALAAADQDVLLVGARGLAESLARKMGRGSPQPAHYCADRVLVVVGSRDPITLPQVRMLRERGQAEYLAAPLGVVDQGGEGAARLVVQAVPDAHGTRVGGDQVGAALAASVHPRLTSGRDALVMTGGATAEAVLQQMGVHHMRLLGEALPGVPVAQIPDGPLVVTKSGGFGNEETLSSLIKIFAAEEGGA